MGLFKKKNQGADTWAAARGTLEDKELSVRVDTKYVHKKYKHTYYIQLKYSELEVTDLPNGKFLEKLYAFEETTFETVKNTFEDHVAFLGTATFGGSSYIIFASNLDIRWEEYIKSTVADNVIAGVYPNDNMGYYNLILYPKYARKHK